MDPPDVPRPRESFTCHKCGATSYHALDVKEGYCGQCHAWTGTLSRARETMRAAYESEVAKQGRPPTSRVFEAEAPSTEPGPSLGSDPG
jgi:hypothetical protein